MYFCKKINNKFNQKKELVLFPPQPKGWGFHKTVYMKQYTDEQQTQELLKLGFPKPECIADYNIGMFDDIEEINAYSAIDLISFLGGHLLKIGT